MQPPTLRSTRRGLIEACQFSRTRQTTHGCSLRAQAANADADARAHAARLESRLEEVAAALRRAEEASASAGGVTRRSVRGLLSELVERVAQQLEGLKASCDADVAAVRAEQAAGQQCAADAVRCAAAAADDAAALRQRVTQLTDAVAARDASIMRADKQLVRARASTQGGTSSR